MCIKSKYSRKGGFKFVKEKPCSSPRNAFSFDELFNLDFTQACLSQATVRQLSDMAHKPIILLGKGRQFLKCKKTRVKLV